MKSEMTGDDFLDAAGSGLVGLIAGGMEWLFAPG
jgi:hypothetical protein